MLPILHSLAFLAALALPSTPADDLLAAAKAGDTPKVATALAAGADANARDAQGNSPLMLAAEAGAFAPCRELLWAGADANLLDKSGRTALQHLGAETPENIPLRFLLRCYAYLQVNAKRAQQRPSQPNLVMIMESTVNYLHPKLKAAYEVDNVELLGKPGVDDDKDGFVDDVYGWVPVRGKPYEIRKSQVDAWQKNHAAIARILQIDEDRATGKITPDEAELRLMEYTNPLSDLMGPLDGLSDKAFLNLLMEAAHGSHVAGIVLDSSEGKARLHTLSIDFAEDSRRLLGPDNDAQMEKLHSDTFIPSVVLQYLHQRLLAWYTKRGQVMSRYLRAKGAGIVNLSFGGGRPAWKNIAAAHIRVALQDSPKNLGFKLAEPDIDALAEKWSFELYSAAAVEIALAAYENPDVLFVVAAGNEAVDDDQEQPTPAYLARFLPNIMTVASVNAQGQLSGFSNYGLQSVDIAAPGENIVSTLFPDANVRMSGTSMATPCVAGIAALVRTLAPALSAAELRRLIDSTARPLDSCVGAVASGGAIDKEALRGCFSGDARARSNAQARIACNAADGSDDTWPRRVADAARAADQALVLDAQNPEAWRGRAAAWRCAGAMPRALEAIDHSLQLDPNSEPAWMERAVIASALKDNARIFESVSKAIEVLGAQGERGRSRRACLLALRAQLHLQLREVEPARADARQARTLEPRVGLPPELEALL